MPHRPTAIAFDVDPDSLASLRQAFPEWRVEVVTGATTDSLDAICGFAGADPEAAIVAPEAQEILTAYDRRVAHYDVVET